MKIGNKAFIFLIIILAIIIISESFLLFFRDELGADAEIDKNILWVLFVSTIAGIILIGYILLDIIIFKKQFRKILKRLLNGDFEVGLVNDRYSEFLGLRELINKFLNRLREYDKLRAVKVAYYNKVVKIIFRSTDEGLMLIDSVRRLIKLNPACQKIFNISQDEFKIDAIINISKNKAFKAALEYVQINKSAKKIKCELSLPIGQSKIRAYFKFIPFRNINENVPVYLIKVSRVE